jgi:glycosyltransferase involved in cell wall biosynthesis
LFQRGQQEGFPVFTLPFNGLNKVRAWWQLRRLLTQENIHILNTHSSLDSWVGFLAWRTLKHGPILVRTRHLSTPVQKSWPTRQLYNAPAAVITTGENISQLLNERVQVPEFRLFAIPTGVSLEDFALRPPDPALRASLGFSPNGFVFGTVSVLRSWKGHLYVLEAMKRLIDRGLEAHLLIVGEGPYRPVIEARLKELSLHERVRLVGYQEHVADWLALMDAFVMASYAHEGIPQALLQALAMAKPVVATEVGGIPEVIIQAETGLLVPPKDPGALADSMIRLTHNPDLMEKLGRQGREVVIKKFSLARMAEIVEAVYDGLILEGGHSPPSG